MLGDIPFEDQPEITDWFFDSLVRKEDESPEDRLFIQQIQFGWIKAYCERAVMLGISAPPIVKVIELIEQDENVSNLFAHLATWASREKDFMTAASLREVCLEKGNRLILHIENVGDCPESLEVFCLMEH